MRFRAKVLAGVLVATAASGAAQAERAIIVLDASASMWGQIEGTPKLEIARDTLRTVLQTVPADLELGLMAYGHREKGSCTDIELVVAPAAGTGGAIADAADTMRFLGKTPLSEAVKQAAQSLRFTEEKATVILITDGIETCNADPCALANELEQSGIDFTTHVVGFGLSDEEGRQVACLADNTGGKYIQAGDAGSLADALTQTVVVQAAPEPEPEPAPAPQPTFEFNFVPTLSLTAESEVIGREGQAWEVYRADASGERGEYLSTEYDNWQGTLEPGTYVIEARLDHAKAEQTVTIEPGTLYEPRFVLNAGTMIIRARPSEGADVEDGAAINVLYPGDGDTTYYGQLDAVFPAGEQVVNVRIGEGSVSETLQLAAGETIERDIVVGVGRLVVNAFYVEGMRVDDGGLALNIVKAAKKIDGSREDVAYGYGSDSSYDLPPGDYAVIARMAEATAEAIVTVKSGELSEASVLLNAGVLAVSAPGASEIVILAAAKDIQGNRQQIVQSYGDTFQTTLTAGDYVVVKNLPDDGPQEETTVTIKAGERSEISMP